MICLGCQVKNDESEVTDEQTEAERSSMGEVLHAKLRVWEEALNTMLCEAANDYGCREWPPVDTEDTLAWMRAVAAVRVLKHGTPEMEALYQETVEVASNLSHLQCECRLRESCDRCTVVMRFVPQVDSIKKADAKRYLTGLEDESRRLPSLCTR